MQVCLAALDAPRIYRLESLPRGPAWSDVQRLLASCAGDRPIEIRDHAMLLLIAVFGLRGGEVRYLRLEDIDWEREIIHIRRGKQRKSQSYPLVQEVGTAMDCNPSSACGPSSKAVPSSLFVASKFV